MERPVNKEVSLSANYLPLTTDQIYKCVGVGVDYHAILNRGKKIYVPSDLIIAPRIKRVEQEEDNYESYVEQYLD